MSLYHTVDRKCCFVLVTETERLQEDMSVIRQSPDDSNVNNDNNPCHNIC